MDPFAMKTVVTVLRRERALFVDNARRCRWDPRQAERFERIIAEFDATIAGIEARMQPTHLKAVA